MALADGDRRHALEHWEAVLEIERSRRSPNVVAAEVWLMGRVFGPETAGGEEEMERARRTLEDAHWQQALQEPDRVLARSR